MSLLTTFLAQVFMASLAMAAPVAEQIVTTQDAWQYGTGGGLVGLIVLILDIIVFVEVFKSNRPPVHKLLWALLVFLFPIGGLIIYWLFSNRSAHSSGAGYETLP